MQALTDHGPDDKDADRLLMARVAQGDAAAYRALLDRHLDACLRFAERMTGARADAEDVLQSVFTRLWQNPAAWRPDARFSTWLYRVVYNACIDQHRRRRPAAELDAAALVDPRPLPDEALLRDEAASGVKQALARLPDLQRAAVILSYYEGLPNQQAAEAMELSLTAFQQLLFRARQNLKADLLQEGAPRAVKGRTT